MVGSPEILLVDRRRALSGALAACALTPFVLSPFALSACRAKPVPVDPRAHQAFFLWAGVAAPPWLAQARTVYLLAGEVRRGGRFVPLRPVPHVTGPEIWLVVRVETLDWEEAVYRALLGRLERWSTAGNRLAGLQIDFDAATHGLERYARFLQDLRQRLAGRWRLSVTGLMDWSAGGDPQGLAALAATVDEVVVQTYQGRRTIPGYHAYLASLQRLRMPYRIGLVEGGEWRAPAGLEDDPRFGGYVVFLLNP